MANYRFKIVRIDRRIAYYEPFGVHFFPFIEQNLAFTQQAINSIKEVAASFPKLTKLTEELNRHMRQFKL